MGDTQSPLLIKTIGTYTLDTVIADVGIGNKMTHCKSICDKEIASDRRSSSLSPSIGSDGSCDQRRSLSGQLVIKLIKR